MPSRYPSPPSARVMLPIPFLAFPPAAAIPRVSSECRPPTFSARPCNSGEGACASMWGMSFRGRWLQLREMRANGTEVAAGTDPTDPLDFPIVHLPALGPWGVGVLVGLLSVLGFGWLRWRTG
jgi:hypothetical protein